MGRKKGRAGERRVVVHHGGKGKGRMNASFENLKLRARRR